MTLNVDNVSAGYRGGSHFSYELDYFSEEITTAAAGGVSCCYPVDFDTHRLSTWPAFLLDILPSGAGRQHWLSHLQISDGPSADWQLLLSGAGFPPGNLRIAEAVRDLGQEVTPNPEGRQIATRDHPGFTLEQILERREHFIEYAATLGAHVAGCSDVQGVAPKFLLVQDYKGHWHAEGALPDSEVASCWIVKFPRGRTEADRTVLANEAPYMAIARALGLNANPDVHWNNDCLFIRRFDRIVNPDKTVQRLGMESLYSLAGVVDFGTAVPQDLFSRALAHYATDPISTLEEYVKRDCLNVMLGNKDNHGRNTAVLRHEDGRVALTPLFDFAPMYLDPEGIARVSRWPKDQESAGQPDWAAVVSHLSGLDDGARRELRRSLAAWGRQVQSLADIMEKSGVSSGIIENRMYSIEENAAQLMELAPTTQILGSNP